MFEDQRAGSSVHCGGVGDSAEGFPLRNQSSGSCQSWSLGSNFINGPFRSVWTEGEKIWLGFTPSPMVERMDSSFYILKVDNSNNFSILSSNRWLIFLPPEGDDTLQSPEEIYLFPVSLSREGVWLISTLVILCCWRVKRGVKDLLFLQGPFMSYLICWGRPGLQWRLNYSRQETGEKERPGEKSLDLGRSHTTGWVTWWLVRK